MRRNETNAKEIRAALGFANVRRLAYTNCAENADVILYTIEGGGHMWPGGKHLAEWIFGRTTDDINATRLMWEFYVQHPRGLK